MTGYKSLICILSLFHVVFVPTSLVPFPSGVMLGMHRSTATNLSATDIEKRIEKVRQARVN